ncbi:MAG TPA: heavy metal translocating P-type ATPase [Methylomirabilota bacterium]
MRYHIAHAVRGRLRVRYPPWWLLERRKDVETGLRALPGIRRVEGSPLTGSVQIDYDPIRVAETALVTKLHALTRALDPSAAPGAARRPEPLTTRQAPLLSVVGTGAVLGLSLLPLSAPLLGGLVLATGLPSLAHAARALGRRRLNGDVLEASTLALLALRGNFTAAALLTWLRALGELVVARSVVTTRRSVRDLVPSWKGHVRRADDPARAVAVTALRAGDVILLGAGEQLPIDGTVVEGQALVNQQTMTGEAMPVERHVGDPVFAATRVEHGQIAVRVDRVGLDTAVGRIISAIEDAAGQKSDIQVFAETLADREVKRTLTLAGLGAALSRSVDAGVAILVADYGTAARIGIPTVVVTSLRRAAEEGILIKGPRALEALARVNTVVFDKTGTLTSGSLVVSRVVAYGPARDEEEVVRLAAAAERGFHHPIARAITHIATMRRLTIPKSTAPAVSAGLGVILNVGEREVLVGSRRFMNERGVSLEGAATDEAAAHRAGGATTFVAVDDRLTGLLVLHDQLRPDARTAVEALRARRMRDVILLSGDHPEPSRVIAETLKLPHHYAGLLPEDKAALIRRLRRRGLVVAMVGDGVNDALALEEADVGIAVPGGAEVASEAADVVLLSGGLDRVVRALDLAHEAIGGVRRTLQIAAGANLGVVGLASLGLARPMASILISHGVTVGAALATAVGRQGRPTGDQGRRHKNVR